MGMGTDKVLEDLWSRERTLKNNSKDTRRMQSDTLRWKQFTFTWSSNAHTYSMYEPSAEHLMQVCAIFCKNITKKWYSASSAAD
jgi:hypothetical protein